MRLLRVRPKVAAPASAEAFRQVYEAHVAFAWRVLRRHAIPERDLDDACQEVFLVVHKRWHDFEGRSQLRTWIYGIAVRVAYGFRRRNRSGERGPETVQPEPMIEPEPFTHALQRQALRELEAALATIAAAQREAFVLYELEGLSMAELAEALEVPENTALYRLHAARAAVSAYMRRRELVLQARQPQRLAKGSSR